MAGKQARILSDAQLRTALLYIETMRHPERNRVMFLLSAKAGLRAAEIAKLTWSMVLGPEGFVMNGIELEDRAAKKLHGGTIPLHPDLKAALDAWRQVSPDTRRNETVIISERGNAMRPTVVVEWFRRVYANLGYQGCSSHSGRRTMITKAARKAPQVGGSIKDVMALSRHRNLASVQLYIESDPEARRKLIKLI